MKQFSTKLTFPGHSGNSELTLVIIIYCVLNGEISTSVIYIVLLATDQAVWQ